MGLTTVTNRASVLGVARPWMRSKQPSLAKDIHWRYASGNSLVVYDFVDPTAWIVSGPSGGAVAGFDDATLTGISPDTDTWVWKDFGVNNIGNFTFRGVINVSSVTTGIGVIVGMFGVGNINGTKQDFIDAGTGVMATMFVTNLGSSVNWKIRDDELVASSSDSGSESFTVPVDWYVTFNRTGTTATLDIRTGSHGGTLEQNLSFTVNDTGYRYAHIFQGNDSGTATPDLDYSVSNVEFSYSDPPPPPSSNYYLGQYQHRFGVMES